MKRVALVALLSLSCTRPEVSAPGGLDTPAAKELLTSEADYAFSIRVDRLRVDPVYSAILHEAAIDKELQPLFETVGSIDGVGAFDDVSLEKPSFVGVLRGPPPLEKLPAKWRDSLEKSGGSKLPSGVWEYAAIHKHGWPYGLYAMDQAWVLLAGHAAGPGHDWFSSHNTPPPPVEFGADVLLGIWVGPKAMKKPAMAEASKQPGSKGLESTTILLRDGAHGDLVYRGVYETTADAESAISVVSKQVGMYASVWKSTRDKCPGLSVLTLESERSGRVVQFRVGHIPEAIRAARDCKW